MTIVTPHTGGPLGQGQGSAPAPWSDGGAGLRVVEAHAGLPVPVESVGLLVHGDYHRDGNDLILTDGQGHGLLVRDYFSQSPPPALETADGARLAAEVVARLAGSLTPGMVAQAGAAAGGVPIGTVSKVSGTVTIVHPDGTRVTPQVGDPVFQGDVVETAADGAVGMTFLDGSAFSLSGNGRMVLDEMVYDPATGDGSSSVSLVAGVFSFVSGGIARSGPDAMNVVTPVATIGVRGTVGLIKIVVPPGTDLTSMDAVREQLGQLGLSLEVSLLPNADGTTGEIVFTPAGGQPQVLNVPYDSVRAVLSLVADGVQANVERFRTSPEDLRDDPTTGRTLDFLPPGSTPEGTNQNPQQPQQQQQGQDSAPQGQSGQATRQAADQSPSTLGYSQGLWGTSLVGLDSGGGLAGLTGAGGNDTLGGGADGAAGLLSGSTNGGDTPLTSSILANILALINDITKTVLSSNTVSNTDTFLSLQGRTTTSSDGTGGDTSSSSESSPDASGGGGHGSGNTGSSSRTYHYYRTVGSSDDPDAAFRASDGSNYHVVGGSGHNVIETGSGDDYIDGGDGDDYLKANDGSDIVSGGNGSDIIVGGSGGGNDTYYGGTSTVDDNPNDWVVYTSTSLGISVDLSQGRAVGSEIGTDELHGIEHVRGGSGNDQISGDGAANRLIGGDGDDTLSGGAGTDTLLGGHGDDVLIHSAGQDVYIGAPNAETAEDDWDLLLVSAGQTLDLGSPWAGADSRFMDAIRLQDGTASLVLAEAGAWSGIFNDRPELWIDAPNGGVVSSGGLTWTFTGRESVGASVYNVFTSGLGSTTVYVSSGALLLGMPSTVVETLTGTAGDDTLDASLNVPYVLQGLGGHDSLTGQSYNDTLQGGDGNDTLNGEDGNDKLYGGSGNDSLNGGTGTDRLWGGDGNDVLQGGLDADTLSGGSGDDTLNGGENDAVNWADYSDVSTSVTVNLATGTATGTDIGSDTLIDIAAARGGSGADTLIGSATDNILEGGLGNDALEGSGGHDTLSGQDGHDSLLGGAGDDLLVGGAGNDTLDGGTGNDTLSGGAGNDTLLGGDGNDVFVWSGGADAYIGAASDTAASTDVDILLVRGNVSLDLGQAWQNGSAYLDGISLDTASANTLIIDSAASWGSVFGKTLYVDGDADDTVVAHLSSASSSGWVYQRDVVRGGVTYHAFTNPGNLVTLFISAAIGTRMGLAVHAGTTQHGTAGNDVLIGGLGSDTLFGYAGNDLLQGNKAADSLDGGDGSDTLQGGDGDDTGLGGLGNDFLDGGNDQDFLAGGDGSDFLYGGTGHDTLSGDGGDDVLSGDGGNDNLDGGSGNDTLSGGTEDDSVAGGIGNDLLSGDDGHDTLYGGEGNDTILGGNGDDFIHGDTPGTPVDYSDILSGGGGDDTVIGGGGNDTLSGGDGHDSLDGEDGDDLIRGGLGQDTLLGGAGNDTLAGDDGDDSIVGDLGNDILAGDNGLDTLTGGDGDDTLTGGTGEDRLFGGLGNDSLEGDDGDDSLVGNEGNDTLRGGLGLDTLEGGLGNDSLSGQSSNDTLLGEDGDDTLWGGLGNDFLDGGAGNDWAFYHDEAGRLSIDLATGEARTFWIDINSTVQTTALDTLAGIENVVGGALCDLIKGNSDDNIIQGLQGHDTLTGLQGSDTLTGGGGNDSLDGGADNDLLQGGTGADTLSGGGGTDTLSGGEGDDLFIWADDALAKYLGADSAVQAAYDTRNTLLVEGGGALDFGSSWAAAGSQFLSRILLGTGANTLTLGTTPWDTVFGTTLWVNGGGDDTVVGQQVGGYDWSYQGTITETVIGASGSSVPHTYYSYGIFSGSQWYVVNIENTVTTSGSFDAVLPTETVAGSAAADNLFLSDTLKPGYIDAGADNDTVVGGDASDTLIGGLGTDTLNGAGGNDLLHGDDPVGPGLAADNGGADALTGGTGHDTLMGWGGNDTLQGGDGDDRLFGNSGDDSLSGGDGNDTLSGGTGNDSLEGGAGTGDWADYSDINDSLNVSFKSNALFNVSGGSGASSWSDTLNGIERFRGGAGNDTLTADSTDSWLDGGAGHDSLIGGGGNDTLVGGGGNDTLVWKGGSAVLFVGATNVLQAERDFDVLKVYTGTSLNLTSANAVFKSGSAYLDAVLLDSGSSMTVASPSVWSSVFGDTLWGIEGSGDASVQLSNDWSFQGETTFAPYGRACYVFSQVLDGKTYWVNLDKTLSVTWSGSLVVNTWSDTLGLDDLKVGQAGADSWAGGAGNDTLFGLGGGDLLNGQNGNDSLSGDSGLDTLYGGLGNDFLDGGDGDDKLFGDDGSLATTDGNDLLRGGDGNDTLWGGAGNDYLDGGAGNDVLAGGAGYDTLNGGEGTDGLDLSRPPVDMLLSSHAAVNLAANQAILTYVGQGSGSQTAVYTLFGIENVLGTAGNDTIVGNDGHNEFIGNGGQDAFYGGNGDDTFWGNSGSGATNLARSFMDGGSGNDIFHLYGQDASGANADTVVGGDGTDTIVYRGQGSGLTLSEATSYSGIERIDFTRVEGTASSGNSLTLTAKGADLAAGSGVNALTGVADSLVVLGSDHGRTSLVLSTDGSSGSWHNAGSVVADFDQDGRSESYSVFQAMTTSSVDVKVYVDASVEVTGTFA